MAIALVLTSRNKGTFGVASNTITLAITPTSGRALRVLVAGDTGFTPSVTDTASNTYTAKGNITHTFYNQKVTEFIAESITGGSITLTANYGGSSNMQWIMTQEVSGQAATSYDGRAAAYQPTASPTSTDGITTGNITPANQPNLFLGIVIGAGSSSPGTGFSFDTFGGDFPIAGSSYGGAWATEYVRTTSTAAKAVTFTNGNSADSILSMGMVLDELVASSVTETRLERYGARGLQRGFR